jgi:hypothetical protein
MLSIRKIIIGGIVQMHKLKERSMELWEGSQKETPPRCRKGV